VFALAESIVEDKPIEQKYYWEKYEKFKGIE
jgi:hypothetical protein